MEIVEVTAKEYIEVIKTPYYVFGSAAFNELNRDKCDEVFYLLFREGKFHLGIIGGCREKIFYSPFSAPFGGFTFISENIRLQNIEKALELLKKWANEKKLEALNIVLPPFAYHNSFISKQTNCLFQMGYKVVKIDLNFSLNLDGFDVNYKDRIWYNARKNLRIAFNAGLNIVKCNEDYEKKIAYDIIRKNRDIRGYPLYMSWYQVINTVQVIPADFFIVFNNQKLPIASAIIFHVNQEIVQVIYWGDLPEFNGLRTMNFLAFKVFEYYKSLCKKIVDIGPSTENSVPNYGLCEFKEGIGCQIDPKFSFIQKLV